MTITETKRRLRARKWVYDHSYTAVASGWGYAETHLGRCGRPGGMVLTIYGTDAADARRRLVEFVEALP